MTREGASDRSYHAAQDARQIVVRLYELQVARRSLRNDLGFRDIVILSLMGWYRANKELARYDADLAERMLKRDMEYYAGLRDDMDLDDIDTLTGDS